MRAFLTLSLILLAGCSGYRFSQQDNPLTQYGIQSLSIPMFYNYSSIPDVSSHFTRETYSLLTQFSGLKLVSGYSEKTDAVMIGIVRSPERVWETQRPTGLRVAKNQAPNAVIGRERFYVPGVTTINLTLQFIIIKRPTEEELALLKSGISEKVTANSRLIFNELIPLNAQFTREILDSEGTEVVGTQNSGLSRRTVRTLAENAALTIRDTILYAF